MPGMSRSSSTRSGLRSLLDVCHRLFAGSGGLDFVLIDFQQGADIPQHSRFVIDQQDVGGVAHWLILDADC